ncbi:MAG: inositol monophosphatase family protein [Pontiellaceae bacterium]
MKKIKIEALLNIAINATKQAGMHALNERHRSKDTVSTEAHDVKLVLDIECQEIAEKIILENYPEHTIIGEEGSSLQSESEYEWIIDPIDGTVNYSHGFSHWCCSIAVRHNNQIIVGVVYAPEYNYLFSAGLNIPAKLNNSIIQPSLTKDLSISLIFTGLNQKSENKINPTFDSFKDLVLNTQKIRITGSCALDLCYVASAKTDGYVEYGVYLWDYAAAGFIAEKAGAVLKVKENSETPPKAAIICCNPYLINDLEVIWKNGLSSL